MSSISLRLTSLAWSLFPVMLPPGRARLETRPAPTMSAAAATTIGMVVVVALAACVPGMPS